MAMTKVKVKVGSLNCEYGTFQKGDVFECPYERAILFAVQDVEIVKEEPVVLSESPQPKPTKKRSRKRDV